MAEDFIKIARKPTLSFSDPALITCFANDYGYDLAILEWIRVVRQAGDCLLAVSSSGESSNIVNAARFMSHQGHPVITFTGFSPDNQLNSIGDIGFHVPLNNYGIVECIHQAYFHMILDSLVANNS
jgi:D-sedoheptulose 7-phosphate isomerase